MAKKRATAEPAEPTEKRGRGRPRVWTTPRSEGRVVIYMQLTPQLKEAIQESAKAQRRTLTAHVTLLLEQAMQAEGRYVPPAE